MSAPFSPPPAPRLRYLDKKKQIFSLSLFYLYSFSSVLALLPVSLGKVWSSCFPYHFQVLPAPGPEAQGSTHTCLLADDLRLSSSPGSLAGVYGPALGSFCLLTISLPVPGRVGGELWPLPGGSPTQRQYGQFFPEALEVLLAPTASPFPPKKSKALPAFPPGDA